MTSALGRAAVSLGRHRSADAAVDQRFMREALALGHRNLGRTWPNPAVGAIVVRETEVGPVVVARGITQPGGRPHAETQALKAAGAAARGATLYVTLEPCSHHGKTPPCCDAVVAAGIKRVVGALEDPNPQVAGEGYRRMRAAGIAVESGVLAREALRTHRGHILRVTHGRPCVTLKLARTVDGFAARTQGARLLVTGETANARVHLMRLHADAVLVGIGTVLADDPQLTVRLPGLERRSPVRVVFDSRLRTPPTARLVATARDVPTWIVTGVDAPRDREAPLGAAGVEALRVAADPSGRLEPLAALTLLGARGITRVFCEGGPALGDALAKADLVDEVVLITGPTPLGEAGLPALGPALATLLADAKRMAQWETFAAGGDIFALYERA
jgi:diaminohydroxyphosphoribosylaminopyrimidine deaminase / 5-amino-6-(5-phosphoribosylamino)uracil reductase